MKHPFARLAVYLGMIGLFLTECGHARETPTVIDFGGMPRYRLGYDLEDQSKEASKTTMELSLSQEIRGTEPRLLSTERMVATMVVAVSGRLARGGYRLVEELGSARALYSPGRQPEEVDDLSRRLMRARGRAMIVEIDHRGMSQHSRPASTSIRPDADLVSSLELLESCVLPEPFPDQEIGVGARWTTEQDWGWAEKGRITALHTLAEFSEGRGMVRTSFHLKNPVNFEFVKDSNGVRWRTVSVEVDVTEKVNFNLRRLTPMYRETVLWARFQIQAPGHRNLFVLVKWDLHAAGGL